MEKALERVDPLQITTSLLLMRRNRNACAPIAVIAADAANGNKPAVPTLRAMSSLLSQQVASSTVHLRGLIKIAD